MCKKQANDVFDGSIQGGEDADFAVGSKLGSRPARHFTPKPETPPAIAG
jgi:hypothetical protein